MSYQPIENYGLIGDLTTTALVGMDGSIDFMCFPRFDSPTIFAAILDDQRGGRFRIAPVSAAFKRRQYYLPETNILITRFLAEDGVAEISDLMSMHHLGHSHNLVRRLKVVRGEIEFHVEFSPRFDYGRASHTIQRHAREFIFAPKGKHLSALRLRTTVPLRVHEGALAATFKLRAGQTAAFILEEATEGQQSPSLNPDYVSTAFKETMNYWRRWIGHSNYRGRWREMVHRSALTLKLLISRPHGSIIAAPTFGLPEKIGGSRNWDYRYTWVRDASFTLNALMRLGFMDEGRCFMDWIEARCQELDPGKPLQVMYSIDGRRKLPESSLSHFEGYRQSSPVRIGNAAANQLQLDIYGELIDAVLNFERRGEPISYDFWCNIRALVEYVCKNWKKPDDGIWEVRGGARPFLYSRVMCWLAIDRAMELARRRSFPAPLVRWHTVRDRIFTDVYESFWNPRLKSFVQYRGANAVDAASLLLPMVDFVSPTDPRWISTLRAIEKRLVDDSLVYRYLPSKAAADGMKGNEGTFSMCSFWYVECLARAKDLQQARLIFEKALGNANHLGLYAEQLGPCGEHLGNFPQALSHIALISSALTLDDLISHADGDDPRQRCRYEPADASEAREPWCGPADPDPGAGADA